MTDKLVDFVTDEDGDLHYPHFIVVMVVGLVAMFVLFVLPISVVQAHFEAQTYNRLTGAHVSTWDAMWVELRVQEGTKP